MGSYLRDNLSSLKNKYPIIKEVRGRGLLIGLELAINIKDFQDICFKNHLLLVPAGNSTIRILPPLNVSKEEIDEMLAVLEQSIKECIID